MKSNETITKNRQKILHDKNDALDTKAKIKIHTSSNFE